MADIKGGITGTVTPNSLLRGSSTGVVPSTLTDDGTTVGLPTGKVLSIVDAAGLLVAGQQVVTGPAEAFIADPTAGSTVDAEARAVIGAILDLLIAKGLMAAS